MSNDYRPKRRTPLTSMAHEEFGPQDPSTLAGGDEGEVEGEGNEPMTVMVVDRKGFFSAAIERAARSLERAPDVVVVTHAPLLMEQVAAESPDVVLAAPEEMTTTGLRRLTQIHRAFPKIAIGLTQGVGLAAIPMTEAAGCGPSEVMTYPASALKLRHALTRLLAAADATRSEKVVIREVITPAPAPAPAPAVAVAPAGSARVFTVTSPTGGCGKTFFATNLAAYLAGATGGRVLLLDLDLQFGEVSLALGLRPQRTISELINEESLTDSFSEYVVDHSAGYQVLAAPADPFAAELVGPREATQVLEAARLLYDYVVVDTPPSLNEVVLAAFDQSRFLVVMATMDVPSLRNLKVFLETIERLKLPTDDVSCVLNKAEPDNGIDLGELLRVYPGGFAAVLPYSRDVSRSLNVGQPVLMVDPRSDISQKLLEACTKLVPTVEVTNPAWAGSLTPKGGGFAGWSHRRRGERVSHTTVAAAEHIAPPAQFHSPAPLRPAAGPGAPRHEPVPVAVALDVGPATWAASQTPTMDPVSLPPAPAPNGTQAMSYPQADPGPWGTQDAPQIAPWGQPPQPRRSWLARLFHRNGRHSNNNQRSPADAYQPQMFQPQTFQLQPLNAHPGAGFPAGATAPPTGQPSPLSQPVAGRPLVYSGSRPIPAGPPSRRRVPDESPSAGRSIASRKEPTR